MLDDDIFSCICSYPHLSFAGKEMSSQHQQNPHSNLDDQPIQSRNQFSLESTFEAQCHEAIFTQINFFPILTQTTEHSEHLTQCSFQPQRLEEPVETILTPKKETVSKATNNAADYIIKHCLKKMISPQHKHQVSSYCHELGLKYQDFVNSWRNKIKELMPRHIGLNRFEKMMKSEDKEVEVLKWFMTVYVQDGYMLYLVKSSIESKAAYIDCAIKFIYIAEVSQEKAYDLLRQAQIGLDE